MHKVTVSFSVKGDFKEQAFIMLMTAACPKLHILFPPASLLPKSKYFSWKILLKFLCSLSAGENKCVLLFLCENHSFFK